MTMGPRSSIWYGAVARADADADRDRRGLQRAGRLHAALRRRASRWSIGKGVTVGHRVVLHGARVDDDVLVGMGSIVMNGAHIGSGSIVAAGAVVTQGTEVPPGSVVAGVPAKVRPPGHGRRPAHIRGNAASYTDRLASARKVRPVVRRPLPPAGRCPATTCPEPAGTVRPAAPSPTAAHQSVYRG